MILTTAGEVRRLGLHWRGPMSGQRQTEEPEVGDWTPVLAWLPEPVMVTIPLDVAKLAWRAIGDAIYDLDNTAPYEALEAAIAEAEADS